MRFCGKDQHPSSWSPAVRTPRKCICRVRPAVCRKMCRMHSTGASRASRILNMRPAYAIEYDCVDPTSLEPRWSKVVRASTVWDSSTAPRLRGSRRAGPAGRSERCPNALGESQLILPRQSSYLGTLVDDLCDQRASWTPPDDDQPQREYRLTPPSGQRRHPIDAHRQGIRPRAG